MRPHQKTGFTLIELLVVIAIIGILIALLLPAVQAAREAARVMRCTSNLKQIGLAMELYEEQHATYVMGRDSRHMMSVSWAFRLLPFMEQQALYDSFVPTARVDSTANIRAMRTPISTFVCPSRRTPIPNRDFDNDEGASQARGVGPPGDYAGNSGKDLEVNEDQGWLTKWSKGPIYTYSAVTRGEVTDGGSNTLAVGERYIPPIPAGSQPGFQHADIGDTAFFSGDNPWTILAVTGPGFPSSDDDPSIVKFGSAHDGIAHFVFLDGHVVALNYSISLDAFKKLSTISGNDYVSSDQY